jgi:predicted amidohydrolase
VEPDTFAPHEQSEQKAMPAASRVIRIALAQLESKLGDESYDPRPANLAAALGAIEQAASKGANLVVFGEMFLTGYRTDQWLHRWASVLEPPGPELQVLMSEARRHDVHLIVGLASFGPSVPGDIYNSAVFIGPRGLIGTYRKTHVAAFSLLDQIAMERCFYSPGNELPVFESDIGRVGIQICYDLSFPEVSRVQTLIGADFLVNISGSAGDASGEEYWDHFAFTRASENAVWFVNCSVVGTQRGDRLFGGSRVHAPDGRTVAKAKIDEEDTLVVDIDLDAIRTERAMSHILSTRNPTIYKPLVEAL